jgi:hypothetical protein
VQALESNVRSVLGEIVVPMRSASSATGATYAPIASYGIAPRKRTVLIEGGYRWSDANFQNLRDIVQQGSESSNMFFELALDYTNRKAIKVTFTSSLRARVFTVASMSVNILQEQGGDFYGL